MKVEGNQARVIFGARPAHSAGRRTIPSITRCAAQGELLAGDKDIPPSRPPDNVEPTW